MKKSVLILISILIQAFALLSKDKPPKNKPIRQGIEVIKHIIRLNHLKVRNENCEKFYYGFHERQYYQVYYPKYYTGQVIFYVHGGGWNIGKPEQHAYLGKWLSEKGFIVILPAYRYNYMASTSEMLTDIREAYRSSMALLEERLYCIEGVIVGGSSAGGHLAALFTLQKDYPSTPPIKGLFCLAAPLDLQTMPFTLPIRKLTQKNTEQLSKYVNPLYYVTSSQTMPVLIVHGKQDAIVPYCASERFAEVYSLNHASILRYELLETFNHIDITSKWYYDEDLRAAIQPLLEAWLTELPQSSKISME